MVEVAKRLIGKYPHVALAFGGLFVFISSFVVAGNVILIVPYFGLHMPYHRWLMLTLGVAHISSVAIGVIMIGGAIIWGMRRQRSNS
jgi:hypothetical protein